MIDGYLVDKSKNLIEALNLLQSGDVAQNPKIICKCFDNQNISFDVDNISILSEPIVFIIGSDVKDSSYTINNNTETEIQLCGYKYTESNVTTHRFEILSVSIRSNNSYDFTVPNSGVGVGSGFIGFLWV